MADTKCKFCPSEKVFKFGVVSRLFWDVPQNGSPVVTDFKGQRLRCCLCKKTWTEYPKGVQKWLQATDALIDYIHAARDQKTQIEIARECGLEVNTIKKIQKKRKTS